MTQSKQEYIQELNTKLDSLVKEMNIALNKEIENGFYTTKEPQHIYNAKDRLMDTHIRLCDQAIKLMYKKNNDYAYGDDPYANFRGSESFDINPIIGILLRMQDKMMRIKTFALSNNLNVKEESVNDSIIDLINYAVLIAGFIEYEKEKRNITA